MTRARWLTMILLVSACLPSTLAGQADVPLNQLGVDVVTLADGRQLRGGIYSQDKRKDLVLAVERAWLKTALPEYYAQQLELEYDDEIDADEIDQILDRTAR